jgi:hypothetical protein
VLDRFDVARDAGRCRRCRSVWSEATSRVLAIARGDGPIVEVLMDAEIPVFVVPS